MERKYKISVKHYLNKKTVKPTINDGVEEYPIYFYITFLRRTIHKPSRIFLTTISENDYNNHPEKWDLSTLLEREKKQVENICNIFLEDYENDRINKKIKYLTQRGFTSKDEIINEINAYYEFYKEEIKFPLKKYVKTLVNNELTEKLKNTFDFSMLENDEISFLKCFEKPISNPRSEINFFINNLNGEILKLYYITSKLERKNKFHFCLCDWKQNKADVLEEIINIVKEDGFVDLVSQIKRIELSPDEITKIITPILDNITDPNYVYQTECLINN